MATITVVSPKTIYPGADSFFRQIIEADSTTVAALRWVQTVATSGTTAQYWSAVASDPTNILGTNMVAGANIGGAGKSATDIFVYVPRTVVEANSNSTGTSDPVAGLAYDIVVSGNDHQIASITVPSTASSATNRGTAIFTVLQNSPKDASLDTNIRVWAMPVSSRLQYVSGL